MTEREPSWLSGYHAALSAECADLVAICIPPEFDECQRMDFVTGFLVGARDRKAAEIMDAMEKAGMPTGFGVPNAAELAGQVRSGAHPNMGAKTLGAIQRSLGKI